MLGELPTPFTTALFTPMCRNVAGKHQSKATPFPKDRREKLGVWWRGRSARTFVFLCLHGSHACDTLCLSTPLPPVEPPLPSSPVALGRLKRGIGTFNGCGDWENSAEEEAEELFRAAPGIRGSTIGRRSDAK